MPPWRQGSQTPCIYKSVLIISFQYAVLIIWCKYHNAQPMLLTLPASLGFNDSFVSVAMYP
jgi:hypothetical protein